MAFSTNHIVKNIDSFLKEKQDIEITFNHPEFLEEYNSLLEKSKENTLTITMPTKRPVPEKTHCWIYFLYKNQRYGFETTIQGYKKDRSLRMILKRPSEILRLQRRKHFRVPVDIPVTFCMEKNLAEEREKTFSGSIQNISAGGILIVTDTLLCLNNQLLLFFNLSRKAQLGKLSAKVIRTGVLDQSNVANHYEYGVQFSNNHGELKNTVLRFIFDYLVERSRQTRTRPKVS